LPKLLRNAFIAVVLDLSGVKNMSEKNDNSKAALHEYVTVAIAEDIDMADEYRDILAKNDIPAVTATQRSYSSVILGVAVMVPESYLEQAQEIIESRQEFDHFLDDTFDDPDELQDEPDPNHFDEDDDFGEEIY
jgi:hypothetical protein